jgi:hypothetical protein
MARFPQILIADASLREAAAPMLFDVTLDRPSAVPITVKYRTGDSGVGNAATPLYLYFNNPDGTYRLDAAGNPIINSGGSNRQAAAFSTDYAYADGQITFLPGETRKSIVVDIRPHVLSDDGDETFAVYLRDGVGASILDGDALGTIISVGTTADSNPVASIADAQISEPVGVDTLSVPLRFQVLLNAAGDCVVHRYRRPTGGV